MGLKIGDISPAAALMGEDGAIKDLIQGAGDAGGMLPALINKRYNKDKKDKMSAEPNATATKAMKKGGKVRGSGCAKRGVRKCKMY